MAGTKTANFNNELMKYKRICLFSYPEAFTYADTRPGHSDKIKRDYIRKQAAGFFPQEVTYKYYAFKIKVWKSGKRPFDLDNVPKLIIDAFCKKQIESDNSEYIHFGLYEDDTISSVNFIQLSGERTTDIDKTEIEILGKN